MKKVLVLEDEASIRSFIVINLQRAGYEVAEAECGEEALAKLQENPDTRLCLLDIMLPDRRVRGLPPHPYVELSDRHHHADGACAGDGQGDGADDRRGRLCDQTLFSG